MKTVRPYPWGSLDSWRRGDVAAWRALRAWVKEATSSEDAARSLTEILGAKVTVSLRKVVRGAPLAELPGSAAALLSPDGSASNIALVEVEGALAARLVAQALRRPLPRVTSTHTVASPNMAGAVAAIWVAASRRAQRSPLRVLGAGSGPNLLRTLLASDPGAPRVDAPQRPVAPELDTATLTITVDDDAFIARLVRRRAPQVRPTMSWSRQELRDLGDLPIGLPIVVCATAARVADIAALRRGDAWMPGTWPLTSRLTGPVWLAAPELEQGTRGELGEGGRVVLRGGTQELGWSTMSEPKERNPLIEAVGEMPIVVRVEVGSATMKAREWAAVRDGDVIALGQRIAEPVILRVGGVEVAKGELVEIEGEVGVRVLARVDAGGTE